MQLHPLHELGHPRTIAEVLAARAERTPDALAYLSTRDVVTDQRLTYGQLDALARGVAKRLRAIGPGPSRVLLAIPSSLPFTVGLFGTLYAGKTAVPVALPRSFEARDEAERQRLLRTVVDCEPSAVLTLGPLAPFLDALLLSGVGPAAPPLLAVDEVDPLPCGRIELAGPDELAVLQYTSGSTREPRGVRVRHENILANQSMIQAAFQTDQTTIVGGWLPPYHDMGLIGNLLHPMYLGVPSILLPTQAFAQRPHLWLKLIDRYRVTTSGGPSFAYELCVRMCRERHVADLDLSCWTLAFDGSEPVRAATHRRFAERFAPQGFSPSSFFPCYGLAEATLFVSGGPRRERGPRTIEVDPSALAEGRVARSRGPHALELVSCGEPSGVAAADLIIADPHELTPLPEGRVGEIWVRGPHVTEGYWGAAGLGPESQIESQPCFGVELGGQKEYLRTGDLGFLLDGELFVTGRLKDLIVVHGKNHYPHDLEATVAAALGVDPMRVAVMSDAIAPDKVAIVVELDRGKPRPSDADLRRVRGDVFGAHGLATGTFVVASPGAIPRTTSGKKQRLLLAQRLAAGALASEPVPSEEAVSQGERS
ncbi:MAG: fatty acyl-AMP ligase [Sandaracinaceae bacterium]|nr:fatty acyl-AMP ligase [Sandaracinaceae bacterium]